MNIKAALEYEHSKKQTLAVVNYIGNDSSRFKILAELFLTPDFVLNQRAAWAVSEVCLEHPELIKPYIGRVLKNLKRKGIHDAVIRNSLRIFQEMDIPEKYCGALFDLCLDYIRNAAMPHGIRAFAITAAFNVCEKYPDLKPELKLILSGLKAYPQPPSISIRMNKVLKKL